MTPLSPEHIVEQDEDKRLRSSPWQLQAHQIDGIIADFTSLVLVAEDLRLACTAESKREFFYWYSIGDRAAIGQEMLEALRVNQWQLKDTRMGLKWLVNKLNKKRPASRKFGDVI